MRKFEHKKRVGYATRRMFEMTKNKSQTPICEKVLTGLLRATRKSGGDFHSDSKMMKVVPNARRPDPKLTLEMTAAPSESPEAIPVGSVYP